MAWTMPKIWKDGRCFIIGGGPSLITQFQIPKETVRRVVKAHQEPSLYSPFMEKIHDEHIIGVNVAYRFGPWVDIMFFGDDSTWSEERNRLLNFNGLICTCSGSFQNIRMIKTLNQNPRKRYGLTLDPSALSWNLNSGAAAINLAVHTGVRQIILLGFDMKVDPQEHQHWHQIYQPMERLAREHTFMKHLKGFPQIQEDAKQIGVEILNANPDSAIQAFRKVNLKDVL